MAEKTKAQLEAELEETKAKLAETEAAAKDGASAPEQEAQRLAAEAQGKIEEANRRAEEIIKAAEARAAALTAQAATTGNAADIAAEAAKGEEFVDYMAPLMGVDAQDVIVGVNGETIRIKRGVPVRIKRKFYEVLMNAAKQEAAAYQVMQQAQQAGNKPLAEM